MNKNIIIGVLVIVIIGVGGYMLIKNKSGQVPVSDSLETSSNVAVQTGMSTYHNDEYGFELQYPSGSTIEASQSGPSGKYIRIDNIASDHGDDPALAASEYLLDIHIRGVLSKDPNPSCNDTNELLGFNESSEVTIGSLTGMRGSVDAVGEFPDGLGLCVNKNGVEYYLSGADGTTDRNTINSILNSFKFTQ